MAPICIRVVPYQDCWRVVSDHWSPEPADTLHTRERALQHALQLAEMMRRRDKRPVLVTVEFDEAVEHHAA